MSYAIASALQAAVYSAITSNPGVQSVVGSDIFDALPSGVLPTTYVVLGEEEVRGKSNSSADAAIHNFTISVISDAAGFANAKLAAVAVSDALKDADLILSRGVLVSLDFVRAKAKRGKTPDGRRIDLRFRARVEDI